ncbi:MAG: hypothetical protein R3C01_04905 [Planctomycetaceae bacterium]
MKRFALFALVALMAAPLFAADEPLAVGTKVPAFYVKDVTGPAAGEKLCYRCRYGNKPVVSIFAREMNANVAELVKQVDAQVAANGDKGMAAFVVLLTEDEAAGAKSLKATADAQGIKKTPLTTFDGAAGPENYKISADADVTVMMWVGGELKVNQAFAKDGLNGEAVKTVVSKTSAILN